MITGTVTPTREALIELDVVGSAGQVLSVRALLDTGFNGWLTLPSATIAALGLNWLRRGRAALADGSHSIFDVDAATVIWDGQPRDVAIDSMDAEPLLGMSLVWQHEIRIEAREQGDVLIQRLKC
ncbi:MAG TPA: clan AA aspartic protease [Phycisphaerae bacterium]|jgi:clan AA aspartic protease